VSTFLFTEENMEMLKFRTGDFQHIIISSYMHSRLHLYLTTFSFHTSLKQHTLEQFINCNTHSYLHSYMGTLIPACRQKLKLGVKKIRHR